MAKTKIPGGYIADNAITGDHIADNVVTSAMLHTSFTVSSSNLSSIDTDNVSEGASNLYFTNARARGAISVSGDLSYNSSTGVISFTNDAGDIESVVAGSGLTGGGTSGDVTLNIGAGTGITVNADDIAVNMSAFDTDNLSEGSSNLYFTNERVDDRVNSLLTAGTGITLTYDDANNTLTIAGAAQYGDSDVESYLSGGTGVTFSTGVISIGQDVSTSATPTFGNTTLTGYLRGPSSFTIDPATHGDDTGTVVIAGNLQVDGTTTTINSTTLSVSDKQVTLGYDATTDAANNNAGIVIHRPETSNAYILWDETNVRFNINRELLVQGQLFLNDPSLGGWIQSDTSVRIDIDGNNDQTDRAFVVSKNNGATDILTISEDTSATFAGTIDSGAITSSGALTGTRVNITNATAPYIVFTEGSNTVHMGLDGGNFWIRQSGLGGGNEVVINSDGSLEVTHDATFAAGVYIGSADTTNGTLTIHGGGTGNNEGGEIRLATAADHDTTYNFYRIDVNSDDLRFGREGETDLIIKNTGSIVIEKAADGLIFPNTHSEDKIRLYDGGSEKIGTASGVLVLTGNTINFKKVGGVPNLQLNGTTWLDSSINLTNIGTITSDYFTTASGEATMYLGTTTPDFKVGRGANEHIKLAVTDSTGSLTYVQDETGSVDHSFTFNIASSSTGANRFNFSKDLNVNGGSVLRMGGTQIIDASTRNMTNIGTISSGAITTSDRLTVTGVGSDNTQPSTNYGYFSGYGAIGNRGTFYVTNGGGTVQIGNGNIHNSNPTATFSTSVVNLGSGRALQMNGTTVINSARDLQNIGTISSGAITSSGQVEGTSFKVENGTHDGFFGSASFSWGGNGSYPTLYSSHSDRWVMMAFPHVTYLENGTNSHTGSTTGATMRMAADASASTYWDIGIGSTTDLFRIGRAGSNALEINSSLNATFAGTVTGTTLSGTQLNLGSQVQLRESTDRADLLQITSVSSTWAGLQVRNSNNEGRWSFMTDGSLAGIYDDENGNWHIQMDENGETRLYYNAGERIAATSVGADVLGQLYVVTATDAKFILQGSNDPYMVFKEGTTDKCHIGWDSTNTRMFFTAIEDNSGGGTQGNFIFKSGDLDDPVKIALAASDGDVFGYIYGSHANDVGFLDDDASWAYRISTDSQHEWRINNGVEMTLTTSALDLEGNNLTNATDIYVADQIIHTGDTNTYTQFHAADQWRVVTGGTERLEVNNGAVTVAGTLSAGAVSSNTIGNLTAGSSGQQMEVGDASVTTLRFDADRWRLYAGNNAGEMLTAKENGNVGIGTSNPSVRFHAVASGANSQFYFQSPTPKIRGIDSNLTTRYWEIGGENGSCGIAVDPGNAQGSSTFGVTIDGQQALYIDSDDRNYVNTSSNPTPSNATGHFNVLADLGDGVNIKHTVNGNNTINIWQTGTTVHSAIAFYKGNTQTNRGTIRVDTNGTSYTSPSDYRLKENILPLSNATTRVMAMNPIQFDWIESGDTAEGFIAHELAEQCPDAVVGEKDAVYGNGDINPQNVDPGKITPLLVKTIQEQQALIESLQTRIEALEGE